MYEIKKKNVKELYSLPKEILFVKNAQSQTKDRGYNLMTKVFVQHVIMLILNKTL